MGVVHNLTVSQNKLRAVRETSSHWYTPLLAVVFEFSHFGVQMRLCYRGFYLLGGRVGWGNVGGQHRTHYKQEDKQIFLLIFQ